MTCRASLLQDYIYCIGGGVDSDALTQTDAIDIFYIDRTLNSLNLEPSSAVLTYYKTGGGGTANHKHYFKTSN